MQMTDLGGLPQSVKSQALKDITIKDFVIQEDMPRVTFTIGKEGKFTNVPGIIISPQGELLPAAASFSFLPSASIGLVPTRKTTPLTNGKDGAIVTYRGGSGRIEITRP